jgi:hypothetical protein
LIINLRSEEPKTLNDINRNENRREISRREVLKSLTAAGIAVAASSFIPQNWSSPQIEGGFLPAHAQSTSCLDILLVIGQNCGGEVVCPTGYDARIDFIYLPTRLVPEKVEIVKFDCECITFKTTFVQPQAGVIYLYVGVESTDECPCVFGFKIRFTNGCVIGPFEGLAKKFRLQQGKLIEQQ